MKKYRKTAIVEAVQWTGENYEEINEFIGQKNLFSNTGLCYIETLEGKMKAISGDFICKGVKGEFWAIKEDIFKETYVEVNLENKVPRSREEIIEDITPLNGGGMQIGRVTHAERIIIEVLLDIRDLSSMKEERVEKTCKLCGTPFKGNYPCQNPECECNSDYCPDPPEHKEEDWEVKFDKEFAWLYDLKTKDSRVKHDFDYDRLKNYIYHRISKTKESEREKFKKLIETRSKCERKDLDEWDRGYYSACEVILSALSALDE